MRRGAFSTYLIEELLRFDGAGGQFVGKGDANAGKPVFGSEIEQVKLGCVAAEGLDYLALGRQTGLMAAKVLKGEAKASDMTYEVISDPSLYINSEALARFGITLSDELAARAIEAE